MATCTSGDWQTFQSTFTLRSLSASTAPKLNYRTFLKTLNPGRSQIMCGRRLTSRRWTPSVIIKIILNFSASSFLIMSLCLLFLSLHSLSSSASLFCHQDNHRDHRWPASFSSTVATMSVGYSPAGSDGQERWTMRTIMKMRSPGNAASWLEKAKKIKLLYASLF